MAAFIAHLSLLLCIVFYFSFHGAFIFVPVLLISLLTCVLCLQTAADSLEKTKADAKLSVKKIQNLEESANKLSKELAAAKSRLLREESVNRELRERWKSDLF